MSHEPPRRWLDIASTAMLAAYTAGIAVVLCQHLFQPPHGDEVTYARWFATFRTDGWLSALRQGHPIGYLAIVQLAGGDWSFLMAGRAISILAILALGLSVWWMTNRFGISPIVRQLAILTFLNLVLAGHGFVFMAIADSLFTLVTLWVVLGIELAVVDRRPGLAILSGAGWAFTWVIRPLAALYALAILGGIGVLIWRDAQRGGAIRLASLVALVGAIGVLSEQAAPLRAYGRPAFESKGNVNRNWPQRRHLSLLRHDEPADRLADWLWVPLVEWDEVRRYTEQHGEDSLPRTRLEAWQRAPLRKLSEVPLTVALRTNFWLGGLLGVLYPLAWFAGSPRERGPSGEGRLTFVGIVVIAYTLVLDVVVSPFLEWRWILLPCVAVVFAGALALERLSATRRGSAQAIVVVQLAFLCASFVFWFGRVLLASRSF